MPHLRDMRISTVLLHKAERIYVDFLQKYNIEVYYNNFSAWFTEYRDVTGDQCISYYLTLQIIPGEDCKHPEAGFSSGK
jgi:hypothetical protein